MQTLRQHVGHHWGDAPRGRGLASPDSGWRTIARESLCGLHRGAAASIAAISERGIEEGVMIDGYTKGVLTVIAAALALLAVGQFTPKVGAQVRDCGESAQSPCYVAVSTSFPVSGLRNRLDVRIVKQ
jgi:hypothetical protein